MSEPAPATYYCIFARRARFDKLFPPSKNRAQKLVATPFRTGQFRRAARANLENPRQEYPQARPPCAIHPAFESAAGAALLPCHCQRDPIKQIERQEYESASCRSPDACTGCRCAEGGPAVQPLVRRISAGETTGDFPVYSLLRPDLRLTVADFHCGPVLTGP